MSDDDLTLPNAPRPEPTKAIKWYDPEGWPRWLRWCLALPLSLLAAVIVYFIYNIVNSFSSEIPTALTGLLAIVVGSAAFVLCGRHVAPGFNRYVGYTFAAALLSAAGYLAGMILTQGSGALPKWYAVLIPIAAAFGALYACFADMPDLHDHEGKEVYSWMPGPLRWLAFIPIALVLSVVVNFALGLPFAFLNLSSDIVKLVNTPITAATFIGVAAAVAPSHKKVVAVTLSVLIAIFAVGLLFSALDRPLTVQIISRLTHTDPSILRFYMSVWYQIMSSISTLAGLLIANFAVFRSVSVSKIPG